MAKLSARGAHKVTEESIDLPTDIEGVGGYIRYTFALRSDGVILRCSQFPFHPHGSYDRRRSTYTIVARIKKGADQRAVFDKFVTSRRARYGITA